jgi:hypothetical protein
LDSRPFPLRRFFIFQNNEWWDANRGEYITAFSQRKLLLASFIFSVAASAGSLPYLFSTAPHKDALTKFFVLSNIRSVSGGSVEMLRASRCLRITLLQSVGPLTLRADALPPCLQPTGLLRDRGAASNLSSALFGFLFNNGFCGGPPSPLE